MNAFAAVVIQKFHELGIEEQLDERQVTEMLETNRKYQALFEYLVDNLDSANVVNSDHMELIQKIEDEQGFDEQQLHDYVKEKDIERVLGMEQDYDRDLLNLENEIKAMDKQIQIKQEQLQQMDYMESHKSKDDDSSSKEALKTQKELKLLIQIQNEDLDKTTSDILQTSNDLIQEYIFISQNSKSEKDQRDKERLILNYNNKILNSNLNQTQELTQQFLNTLNILSNNLILELRNEVTSKTDVQGMREGIMNEDQEYSEEIRNYIMEKQKLVIDLDNVKEQLVRVKKDNLCTQLNYERWKMTFDNLEVSKQPSGRKDSESIPQDLIQELQQYTNELLLQVLDLQEQDLLSRISLVKEEVNAKSNLQEENIKEQTMLTNIKMSEAKLEKALFIIHLVQMIVEWDQYQTQEVFDKIQQIVKAAEEWKFKIDLEDRNFEEVLKINSDKEAKRTTLDERDQFMVNLKNLVNKIGMNGTDENLFTYKQEIKDRLAQVILDSNPDSSIATKSLSKSDQMSLKVLIEVFKSTFDRRKGDLVSQNDSRQSKLQEVYVLLDEYNQNVEIFKQQVMQDKLGNTAKGNGIEIKSEEIITDFLNHRSEKLKKIFK